MGGVRVCCGDPGPTHGPSLNARPAPPYRVTKGLTKRWRLGWSVAVGMGTVSRESQRAKEAAAVEQRRSQYRAFDPDDEDEWEAAANASTQVVIIQAQPTLAP